MDRSMDPVAVNIVQQLKRKHWQEMDVANRSRHQTNFERAVLKACLIMKECGPTPEAEEEAFTKIIDLLEDFLEDVEDFRQFTELASNHMGPEDIAQIKHYVSLPHVYKAEHNVSCLCSTCANFYRTH